MTAKPRIVLRIPGPRPKKNLNLAGMIRVSPEAEIAVRNLADETGLSYAKVASSLLIQAAAMCEIEREGGERA